MTNKNTGLVEIDLNDNFLSQLDSLNDYVEPSSGSDVSDSGSDVSVEEPKPKKVVKTKKAKMTEEEKKQKKVREVWARFSEIEQDGFITYVKACRYDAVVKYNSVVWYDNVKKKIDEMLERVAALNVERPYYSLKRDNDKLVLTLRAIEGAELDFDIFGTLTKGDKQVNLIWSILPVIQDMKKLDADAIQQSVNTMKALDNVSVVYSEEDKDRVITITFNEDYFIKAYPIDERELEKNNLNEKLAYMLNSVVFTVIERDIEKLADKVDQHMHKVGKVVRRFKTVAMDDFFNLADNTIKAGNNSFEIWGDKYECPITPQVCERDADADGDFIPTEELINYNYEDADFDHFYVK